MPYFERLQQERAVRATALQVGHGARLLQAHGCGGDALGKRDQTLLQGNTIRTVNTPDFGRVLMWVIKTDKQDTRGRPGRVDQKVEKRANGFGQGNRVIESGQRLN